MARKTRDPGVHFTCLIWAYMTTDRRVVSRIMAHWALGNRALAAEALRAVEAIRLNSGETATSDRVSASDEFRETAEQYRTNHRAACNRGRLKSLSEIIALVRQSR